MTPGTFLDPAALAIVLGGTMAATVLRTPLRDLARALAALTTLGRRRFDPDPLLAQLAAQGRIAQKKPGWSRWTAASSPTPISPPRSPGSSTASRRLRSSPSSNAAARRGSRAMPPPRIPGPGWPTSRPRWTIRTLVGLVAMFARMTDPQAIGAAMAVALLATLYGASLANLVALPIAARLRAAGRAEADGRLRLTAPVAALAEREAPRPAVSRARPLADLAGSPPTIRSRPPPGVRPGWSRSPTSRCCWSASSCLMQANHTIPPEKLGMLAGRRVRGRVRIRVDTAPAPIAVEAHDVAGFAPGATHVAALPPGLVAWAKATARDPRVALTVTGSTDGTADDVDLASGSAAVLAADRAGAVVARLADAGVPVARTTIATAARPAGRRVVVTLAFAGEEEKTLMIAR
ncbi:MotA/TolQ/ExbB proton channel family protein [Sphingomonas sp. MMS24-JH45]